MMKLNVAVAAACVCVTMSIAGPEARASLINGFISESDGYSLVISDEIGEPGLDSSALDIASLYCSADGVYLNFGITVNSGPIEQYGGSTSFIGSTRFWIMLQDSPTGAQRYMFQVDMGDVQQVQLYRRSGTRWVLQPLADGDCDWAVSGDLEFRITRSALSALPGESFHVVGQLDDNGQAKDDQVSGTVPEPASLAILAMGGLLVAMRRHRRHTA